FFGVQPDMTVIEMIPGGGWYTELLAPLLNANGQYIAGIAKSSKPDSEANGANTIVHKLIKAFPAQFGHAKVVRFDSHAPVLGPAGSADAVLTFRNVHNWVMGDYAPQMFAAFFKVLKPGGLLGVADHRASAGDKLDAALKKTGYLPQAYVIKLATDAGFKLAAKSEINANPKDSHDHPKGVWTLPPTLALGDKDKAKYLAIGESDRMTLRFVKPAAPADVIKRAGMETPPSAASSVAH
ncbi:MAG: methyltransferase, partial [Xanthomonadales bacterium]|nr:methyltransferase [Xanthomonadales bacterium]